MTVRSTILGALLITATAVALAPQASATEFVQNGSFENGNFAPGPADCCNYMRVANGSSAISSWTVVTGGPIAWGVGATEFGPAADGIAYIDLTGFGNESLNGSVQQLLATTPGQTYKFSFDSIGDLPQVRIGSQVISFSATGSEGLWTVEAGTFTAPSEPQVLSITNVTPGSLVVFVDDVSVASVPEPAT